MLDSWVAQELALPFDGKEVSVNGVVRQTVKIENARILSDGPGIPLNTKSVAVLKDWKRDRTSTGERIAGTIGIAALAGYVVTMDFVRQTLVFETATTFQKPERGYEFTIPLQRVSESDPRWLLSLQLSTDHTVEALLDTGAFASLLGNRDWVPENAMWSERKIPIRAISQQFEAKEALLPRMWVVSEKEGIKTAFTEPNVYFTVVLDDVEGFTNVAIVGIEFLKRFTVTLDCTKGMLYLNRSSDYAHRSRPPGSSGLELVRVDDSAPVQVKKVLYGSAAYESGIRPEDEVITLQGKALTRHDPIRLIEEYLNLYSDDTMELTVRSPKMMERTVRLTPRNRFASNARPELGMSLILNTGGELLVQEVVPGSAADKSGLHSGDIVLEIDGKSTRSLSTDEIVQAVARVHSQPIKFKVRRDENVLEITLRLVP